MSLRPRPVTATVTKPKWMEPQSFRPRSYSLESNGSTASLTSVLDHDSYESPGPSDDELETDNQDKRESIRTDEETSPGEDFSQKERIQRKLAEYEDSTFTEVSQQQVEDKLSPWEKWLITKTKNERFKRREIQRHKKEEKQKMEEELLLKKRNEEKAAEKRQKWLEEKNYEERLRRKLEKQHIRKEKELKEQKQRTVAVKSDENFKKWKAEKNKELKEKLKHEKQQAKEEELKREEQKQKAELKYNLWLKQANSRPKSAPNSFGYASGKLTGYHDSGAYPEPTFYNPMPWHYTAVPSKSERSKKKTSKSKKYVWNPTKYL